ncbi:hypothetical protein D3C87_36490 [compost metagenome]
MRLIFFLLTFCFCIPAKAQFNNSLDFDGINDYVNLNSVASALTNETSFTVEFWIKANPIQQEEWGVLFAINPIAGNSHNTLVIRMSGPGDGGALNSVAINVPVGSTNNVVCGSINVLDNACHHVAYTYNNGINTLFIDGIFQVSLNQSFSLKSTDRYSLGQEFDLPMGTLSQFYKGTMDDLRIWNFVKSQAQVQALMNQELTGTETGLLAYYNFNQGIASGNNTAINSLTDNSGNNQSGFFLGFSLNGAHSNFVEVTCCDFYGNYQAATNQPFSLNTIITNEHCGNQDGSINVNVPLIPNNYSFEWPSLNEIGHFVQNLTAGTYSLTITDNQGCFIDTTLLVTNFSAGSVPAPQPLIYCQNDVAEPLQLTPAAGGTIHWYSDPIMTNTLSGNPVPSTSNPGTFYYYFSQEMNGCFSSVDSVRITISPAIAVNIGNDTTLCSGESLHLSIIGNYSSIAWNDGSNSANYTISTSGNYWVTVTSGVCFASDTINVNFYPEIEVSLGSDTSICNGTTINLSAEETVGSYSWSTGETSPTIAVDSPGSYSVEVTAGGCTNSDVITVSWLPSIEIGLLSDTLLCSNKVNVLSINSEYEVTWNSNLAGNSYTVPESHPSSIIYEVTDACGAITDTVQLTYTNCECLLFVPNSFTPDGDEFNNSFQVISTCDLSYFQLLVFNRWGELIFESYDRNHLWDGTHHGTICPFGLYNWKVTYRADSSETIEKHGHINIIR